MKLYGTVHLMEYIATPRGQVRGLTGTIEILSDDQAVGFKARGSNSANWMARISGETQTWHVFGCQIRAIAEHPQDATALVDCWTVA